MLKKTFSKSRLSPDTLDRVKMGVMLPGRAQVCDQHKQTFYYYEFYIKEEAYMFLQNKKKP